MILINTIINYNLVTIYQLLKMIHLFSINNTVTLLFVLYLLVYTLNYLYFKYKYLTTDTLQY